MNIHLLKKLGFSDKSAEIYLALLKLGPSAVRTLADHVGLNRGTTYDALKWLQEQGVVTYYKKDSKQHFIADNPETLHRMIHRQEEALKRIDTEIEKHLPELKALFHKGGERPVARYFSKKEINRILEDVLAVCEESEEKEYQIYSAEGLREYMYEGFPTFSDVRIAKGISVKVIALGEGGELRGLDERKWLKSKSDTPTYIILYPGKTAYISLNAKQEPVGVVIENDGVYQTQKSIFDILWKTL
jgi:HTH-type transcriptional regulator, sugar sensing transcriptional regulator